MPPNTSMVRDVWAVTTLKGAAGHTHSVSDLLSARYNCKALECRPRQRLPDHGGRRKTVVIALHEKHVPGVLHRLPIDVISKRRL